MVVIVGFCCCCIQIWIHRSVPVLCCCCVLYASCFDLAMSGAQTFGLLLVTCIDSSCQVHVSCSWLVLMSSSFKFQVSSSRSSSSSSFSFSVPGYSLGLFCSIYSVSYILVLSQLLLGLFMFLLLVSVPAQSCLRDPALFGHLQLVPIVTKALLTFYWLACTQRWLACTQRLIILLMQYISIAYGSNKACSLENVKECIENKSSSDRLQHPNNILSYRIIR